MKLHAVFHSTNLHSYQQCVRVSFSPRPYQYSLLLALFIIDRCGSVCISLMFSDVEYLFMYLLVFCMSYLKNMSVQILQKDILRPHTRYLYL